MRSTTPRTRVLKAAAKVSKKFIVAPSIPVEELMLLRAHIDEAIDDPDYTVVVSYECVWDEPDLSRFGSNFGFLGIPQLSNP
jgi:hypothetical protein